MEPLAVLSLVANITQVVDFGAKLLLTIRQLIADGSTAGNAELEEDVGVLRSLTGA
jgi:hypothetical protein